MKIAEKFKKKKVISFEVFPPKKDYPVESITGILEELCDLSPDFISVTYGAGGNMADKSTIEIASKIKETYGIDSAAHLTCINSTKEEIDKRIEDLKNYNIENVLALRGDYIEGVEPKNGFKYSSELVEYVKSKIDIGISGACYPEIHIDSKNRGSDIFYLKKKVDAGAEHLISQLFFSNEDFLKMRADSRKCGITVPIEAGIMPIVSRKQIEKMVAMCGASLPSRVAKIVQKYEFNKEALRDAGIAYATEQIVELLSDGVEGVHIYTMNNPYVAKKIHESVKNLL